MFGGVKITLIICLTIITSCVLFISYNEYSGRYSIVSTSDNGIYIFDKKSTVLNRCDGKNCIVIETKLPTKTILNQDSGFQQSKLFESEKPMATATLISNAQNPEAKSNNPEINGTTQSNLPSPGQADSNPEVTSDQSKSTESSGVSSESKDDQTEKQNEEEFIE